MKKHLFGMALLTCLVVMGGMASAQTIDDIQQYDPVTGDQTSPFFGQNVTVSGVVTVIKGTFNSGTFYFEDATGGINFFDSAAGPFALGDIIEVTGTVGQFFGELNISGASAVLIGMGPEVVPALEPLSNVVGNYEQIGALIAVIGEIATKENDRFEIFTGSDTLLIFIDSDTGIDLSLVDVGDTYQVSGVASLFGGNVQMKSRFQGDLVENPGGDTLPVISNVNSPNWVLEAADPLTVTAVITDDSAITGATLYYADSDGTTQGAFSSVTMTNTGGDNYSGTIPGGHTGSQVDFYVEATDDGAQMVTNPGTAPATFLSAAVGFTSLYAINTVHPDSSSQTPPLINTFVNIKGVVIGGTGSDTGAQSRIVLQEADKNPLTNSYAFGGILIFEGTGTYQYFRGDELELGGEISSFFGLNELLPFNADAVNLIGFGANLPEAQVHSSAELGGKVHVPGEGMSGTRWESVWVKTHPAVVVDTLGFGDYIVSTTPARADSVDIAPINLLAYQPVIGDVLTIEGYMTFSGGDYRLVPIADEFIILTGLSAVDDTPTIQKAGGFRSIHPNPFNPMTEIKFVVNRGDLVQLNVYNIRGEKVRTIVEGHLPANDYTMHFDGKNDAGQSLSSGAYFARLRIGKEVVQVRQMMLVK